MTNAQAHYYAILIFTGLIGASYSAASLGAALAYGDTGWALWSSFAMSLNVLLMLSPLFHADQH